MTVLYDAYTRSTRTATTNPYSFSHTGRAEASGGVQAVVVSFVNYTSNTDHVSAVTYGGVSLTRIVGIGSAGTTEPTHSSLWFAGSGLTGGTQTVEVTFSSDTDDDYQIVASTWTAKTDVIVLDSDSTNPSTSGTIAVWLHPGDGQIVSTAVAAWGSGTTSAGNLSGVSNIVSDNTGSEVQVVGRQTTPAIGDFRIGWQFVLSSDNSLAALTMADPLDVAIVTQAPLEVVVLPTTASAHVSQALVEAVVEPTSQSARVTQTSRLVAIESEPNARVSQTSRLVAIESEPNALVTQTSRLVVQQSPISTLGATKTTADPQVINLPAYEAGDLIIVQAYAPGISVDQNSWTFDGSTTAFTQLWKVGSIGGKVAVKYRLMQSGDTGTTISIDLTGSATLAYNTFKIPAGTFDPYVAPEAAVSTENVTATPDPPSLTPSWGSANNLWLALSATKDNPTLSSYPTGFTGLGYFASATEGVAAAFKFEEAASVDPGVFTWATSKYSTAGVIAIKPILAFEGTSSVSHGHSVTLAGSKGSRLAISHGHTVTLAGARTAFQPGAFQADAFQTIFVETTNDKSGSTSVSHGHTVTLAGYRTESVFAPALEVISELQPPTLVATLESPSLSLVAEIPAPSTLSTVSVVSLEVVTEAVAPTLISTLEAATLSVDTTTPVPTLIATVEAIELAGTWSIPEPIIIGSTVIEVPPMAVTGSIPEPTTSISLIAEPMTAEWLVPAPTAVISVTSGLSVEFSIPAPIAVTESVISAPAMSFVAEIPAPVTNFVALVPPLSATWSLTPPSTGGDITSQVPPLRLQSILPAPTVKRDIRLLPPALRSVASISSPYVVVGLTSWNWSYRVGGLELNDGRNFVTSIPELENDSEDDVVLVPIDGDYPKFVRLQPREAQYTFLIAMKPCNWATYKYRLEQLKSVLKQGSSVRLDYQVRGMSSPKSMNIQVKSFLIDPKNRLVTVSAVVARPIPM